MKIDQNNPIRKQKYKKAAKVFIIVGAIAALIGITLFILSLADFGGSGQFFFLGFIAMPFMFVGFSCLMLGLMGPMARYQSSVAAPVKKDYVNYMREETADTAKEYYRDVASGIREGLHEGSDASEVRCSRCGEMNPKGARFCKNCGSAHDDRKECPTCHHMNPSDAKYCNSCGREL